MSFTSKIAAGVLLAAAASTALTGCGKKTSTNTTSSSPSMSSSSSKTASSSMSSTSSSMSSSSSTNSGYTQGTINGKVKNLRAGEQCQKAYASQYTQYGFTCAPKSSGDTAYYLTKN